MLVVAGDVGDGIALDRDGLMLPRRGKVCPRLDNKTIRTELNGYIERDLMLPLLPLDGEEDMLGILVSHLVASLTI